VAVERLAIGDLVLTLDGRRLPINWIGFGQSVLPHGRRSPATPVIVRTGALGDGVPRRDLRVTKGHSLYLEGALIPVENLINHRTILWDDEARSVVVYHLELDSHEVLLADGAPAESYRDDGNRVQFQNVNPDWDVAPVPEPLVTGGPVVSALWQHLPRRAPPRAPIPMTDDPDLHLLVDGTPVAPSIARHGIHAFEITAGAIEVAVTSRSAIPSELGVNNDQRRLGVAVRRIVLRQPGWKLEIDAVSAALEAGFQQYEAGGFRWTDGAGLIPPSALKACIPGQSITIEVDVACTARYRAPDPQPRSSRAELVA
jgi:Hint domain